MNFLIKKNIFYPKYANVKISKSFLSILKRRAKKNKNKKSMILIHRNAKQRLHEMLICHAKGKKIYPHINKYSEKSYKVIYGSFLVKIIDFKGNIKKIYKMNSKKIFFLRLKKNQIHTIKLLSNYCIFFETILGPHKKTKYYNINV